MCSCSRWPRRYTCLDFDTDSIRIHRCPFRSGFLEIKLYNYDFGDNEADTRSFSVKFPRDICVILYLDWQQNRTSLNTYKWTVNKKKMPFKRVKKQKYPKCIYRNHKYLNIAKKEFKRNVVAKHVLYFVKFVFFSFVFFLFTCKTGDTYTIVTIDVIRTCGSILTRGGRAFIDVRFTMRIYSKTRLTCLLKTTKFGFDVAYVGKQNKT